MAATVMGPHHEQFAPFLHPDLHRHTVQTLLDNLHKKRTAAENEQPSSKKNDQEKKKKKICQNWHHHHKMSTLKLQHTSDARQAPTATPPSSIPHALTPPAAATATAVSADSIIEKDAADAAAWSS